MLVYLHHLKMLKLITSNPKHVKIGNEIIKYTGVTTTTSSLNNITRSMDETKAEIITSMIRYSSMN